MQSKERDFTSAEMEMILNWLLQQRLSNYGYDWKDFKRLSNYASKFRVLIRKHYNNIIILEKVKKGNFMGGRLLVNDKNRVDYIVGQSFNEEYINLMADILERAGIYKPKIDWYM